MKKIAMLLRIIASVAMCIVVITGTVYFIGEFWPSFPDLVMNRLHISGGCDVLYDLSGCSLVVVVVSYVLMRKLSHK